MRSIVISLTCLVFFQLSAMDHSQAVYCQMVEIEESRPRLMSIAVQSPIASSSLAKKTPDNLSPDLFSVPNSTSHRLPELAEFQATLTQLLPEIPNAHDNAFSETPNRGVIKLTPARLQELQNRIILVAQERDPEVFLQDPFFKKLRLQQRCKKYTMYACSGVCWTAVICGAVTGFWSLTR